MAAMATLMTLSVVLRTGVFGGVGEYSDIVHLYRRDGLVDHPTPYFDYPLEYPVLIGAFEWVVGFVRWSAGLYFVASAAILGALGLATVRLLGEVRTANPWILAAAPAVVFWGVQNWDFLAIFPLVAALVLHLRGRDGWGAAALALGASAKLFPLVVLPVVLVVRAAQGRWRSAGVILVAFVSVTVAVNLPVAIDAGGGDGLGLRDQWTYFFEFSRDRLPMDTLWTELSATVPETNLASGLMLATGTVILLGLTVRCVRRGQDPLVPAAAAALLWLFATNKVYSAQYALWIMLALALVAAPLRLVAVFVAVDILFFITLWGGLPWLGELPTDLRQVVTAGLAAWVALRMARPGDENAYAPLRSS